MHIYLDNAATTQPTPKVVAEMQKAMEQFGNPSSLHQWGASAKKIVEDARKRIADALGARPSEIIFTSGGTESNNLAIKGIVTAQKKKGNHIITSAIEHPSVLETCRFLEGQGFTVTCLRVDKEGFVDVQQLEQSITDKTVLVSVMHANNEIGTLQPLAEIAQICKKRKVILHTDAVQSFCKAPLDVGAWDVDSCSISAHKIHGPKGVGALYVKSGVRLEKQLYGGHQEQDMRPGTENVPGIVGFGAAVHLYSPKDVQQMQVLRDLFMEQLKGMGGVINGPQGKHRLCNNISVSFRKKDGVQLLLQLDKTGIAASTGSACSSQSITPSHVLSAIGLREPFVGGTLRFSLSKYTTKEEVMHTVKTLRELLYSRLQ